MLRLLIELCVRRRIAALVVTAAIAAYGVNAYLSLPVEAYPDVTNVQVVVIAQLPGAGAGGNRAPGHGADRAGAQRHARARC